MMSTTSTHSTNKPAEFCSESIACLSSWIVAGLTWCLQHNLCVFNRIKIGQSIRAKEQEWDKLEIAILLAKSNHKQFRSLNSCSVRKDPSFRSLTVPGLSVSCGRCLGMTTDTICAIKNLKVPMSLLSVIFDIVILTSRLQNVDFRSLSSFNDCHALITTYRLSFFIFNDLLKNCM